MRDEGRSTRVEVQGTRYEVRGTRDEIRGTRYEVRETRKGGGMRDKQGGKNRIGKRSVLEELRSRDERLEEARREGEGEKPEGEV